MRSKVFQQILDETPKDVEIFVSLYAALVLRINQVLQEKRMTQKELAAKMEKSPSEISKWLSGEHNFTLRSIAKLSAELDEILLEVPVKRSFVEFENSSRTVTIRLRMQTTPKYIRKENEEWKSAAPVSESGYAA